MRGGALGAEEAVAASVDEIMECPLFYVEVDPKKMQDMPGHILEKEVGRVYVQLQD